MLHRALMAVSIRRIATAVLMTAALAGPALSQGIPDNLGVPGPISYDGTDYELSWGSTPSADYIKQEYVPQGQSPDGYNQMILVETLKGSTVSAVAKSQMDILTERKAVDPLVNMDLILNDATGEAILDFLVSGEDPNGEKIVEWNAYRYVPQTSEDGTNGTLLFGISHRAYGDENSKAFMGALKTLRTEQIAAIAAATLPDIK